MWVTAETCSNTLLQRYTHLRPLTAHSHILLPRTNNSLRLTMGNTHIKGKKQFPRSNKICTAVLAQSKGHYTEDQFQCFSSHFLPLGHAKRPTCAQEVRSLDPLAKRTTTWVLKLHCLYYIQGCAPLWLSLEKTNCRKMYSPFPHFYPGWAPRGGSSMCMWSLPFYLRILALVKLLVDLSWACCIDITWE